MTDGKLKVAEVAALIGVPVPTIRSWEKRYGWPRPARTQGNHRRYDPAEVEQLRALRDEISKGRSAQRAVVLLQQIAHRRSDDYVGEIVRAAIAMDQDGITHALAVAETAMSVEEAVEGVVLPALREIGRQWEQGRCNVAGEHIATRHIKQWLGTLLERHRPQTSKGAILMCTGPADFHSLALEAFSLLLVHRNWNPIVLGAQTPVASLVEATRALEPRAVVVASHMAATRRPAIDSLKAVASLGTVCVFFAGNGFAPVRSRRGVPGSYLGADMTAAAGLIDRTVAGQPVLA
ncbi:MAG: MerR family transcriptional regulator [Actinomycetota bacterium]|nr:MerR family transcriptional regulator [Actinomycetota bacterium]